MILSAAYLHNFLTKQKTKVPTLSIVDENCRSRPSPGVPRDEECRQWMKQVGLSDPRRKEKNVEG
jgi:hypothetical protein